MKSTIFKRRFHFKMKNLFSIFKSTRAAYFLMFLKYDLRPFLKLYLVSKAFTK